MKSIKLISALVILGAGSINSAWADGYRGHRHGGHWGHGGHHGGHARLGISIGVPLGGWYYPPAYYHSPYAYYPQVAPVILQPREPQVYIEQQQEFAASDDYAETPDNYWYYCVKSKSYYPYVKECSSGWQKVLPQPPGQP